MANKKVKSVAKKTLFQNNITRIAETAKNINEQLVEVAAEIVKDVQVNTKEVTKITSKPLNKLKFRNSLNKVVNTGLNINADVMTTVSEVVGATVTTAKQRVAAIDVAKNIDQIKDTAIQANDYAADTVEEVVTVALKNGEKWQNITEKAVKGGLQLADRQQDIFFNTLTTVKAQLLDSADRFKTILSKN